MQQELDRSLLSAQMLEQSSATLSQTSQEYTRFSSLMNISKALITSLESADTLDRLIIMAALVFFILCCIWVLKRRVLDKGLRLVALIGRPLMGKAKVGQAMVSRATSIGASATSIAMSKASVLASSSNPVPFSINPLDELTTAASSPLLGNEDDIKTLYVTFDDGSASADDSTFVSPNPTTLDQLYPMPTQRHQHSGSQIADEHVEL